MIADKPEKKKIFLRGREIEYALKKSRRARRMRMSISCGGNFSVTIPRGFDADAAEKFIREKAFWILDKIAYFQKFKNKVFLGGSRREYLESKNKALALAGERIKYFNGIYNFRYGRISIRNQRTRWGSCSRKGNLNFNYKLLILPPKIADYIIVHELCHLKEFNHSRDFWRLVAETIPDYREIRKKLLGL